MAKKDTDVFPCKNCCHPRRDHFFAEHPHRFNTQGIYCNQCGTTCGATQRSDRGLYQWLNARRSPEKMAEYNKTASQTDRAMRILRDNHREEYNRILLSIMIEEV